LAKVWASALEHAALPAEECVVILVKATMPRGTADAGYLFPGPPPDFHVRLSPAILRWIPPETLTAYEERHRVAVWSRQPRAPYSLLGPLLRHELQHAVQWKRFGRPFFELRNHLLDAWQTDPAGPGYFELPAEQDANAAAAAYAVDTLRDVELEALRRKKRYRQIVEEADPLGGNVLDESLSTARTAGDRFLPELDPADRADAIKRLEEEARSWPSEMVWPNPAEPGVVVVKPFNWRALLRSDQRGSETDCGKRFKCHSECE